MYTSRLLRKPLAVLLLAYVIYFITPLLQLSPSKCLLSLITAFYINLVKFYIDNSA
ncbi:MAG: hypothetical protein ACJAVV_001485 [Alphaproteobacteria bacterium]|jgi:hypothetical protein